MNAMARIRTRPVPMPVEAEAITIRTRQRPIPLPPPEPEQPQPPSQEVRQRVRGSGEPTLPTQWQNGSAVFREGFTRKHPRWIVDDETSGGLLGRTHKVNTGYHVWRWNIVRKAYVYCGHANDHLGALGLLP